ncbi:MAG: hypothetical protein IKZ08_00180 [Bacteroidales bacterium]|nr:hypothetical protein [Bacteroidales bacterium]
MNTDVNVLMKSFNETERMMDALIDRVMARDGIWFKTELAGQYKGKVAISELESLCQLLVTADVVRFELELLERITNEDADRFDDKVFMLAQIAYHIADELQGEHPQQVESIRQRLDELLPNDEDEDELWA